MPQQQLIYELQNSMADNNHPQECQTLSHKNIGIEKIHVTIVCEKLIESKQGEAGIEGQKYYQVSGGKQVFYAVYFSDRFNQVRKVVYYAFSETPLAYFEGIDCERRVIIVHHHQCGSEQGGYYSRVFAHQQFCCLGRDHSQSGHKYLMSQNEGASKQTCPSPTSKSAIFEKSMLEPKVEEAYKTNANKSFQFTQAKTTQPESYCEKQCHFQKRFILILLMKPHNFVTHIVVAGNSRRSRRGSGFVVLLFFFHFGEIGVVSVGWVGGFHDRQRTRIETEQVYLFQGRESESVRVQHLFKIQLQ